MIGNSYQSLNTEYANKKDELLESCVLDIQLGWTINSAGWVHTNILFLPPSTLLLKKIDSRLPMIVYVDHQPDK